MSKQSAELKTFQVLQVIFKVKGDSPLIMHRWSEKSKKLMLDKQMKKIVTRDAKDPIRDFEESMYKLPDGRAGFPAAAFKNAMVRAGKNLGVMMTDSRVSIFVRGVYSEIDGRDLIPIDGEVSMREDMVRLETGIADIRYRAQISNWSAEILIEYTPHAVSLDQIVSLLNAAGFVGVGEWRPERNGEFGRFHVVEE